MTVSNRPRPKDRTISLLVTRDDRDPPETARLEATVPAALTIGRNVGCDIVLESDQISRTHARLILAPASFVVEDTSSNGTMVTSSEDVLHHQHRELPYGESLRIGGFTLQIGESGQTRAAPPRTSVPMPPRSPAKAAKDGPTYIPPKASPPTLPVPALSSRNALPTKNALPTVAPPPEKSVPAAPAPSSKALLSPLSIDVQGEDVALRRSIHTELLKNLDLGKIDPNKDDPSLRPRVLTALKRIFREREQQLPLPAHIDRDAFISELLDEAIGLGPLEPLLADPSVTEIMVVDPITIYIERHGRLERTTTRFTDDERVRAIIERIITPLGRRIDESQPLVDARLKDGSRVNAIIRPLALRGTCITIRKFPLERLTVKDLLELGSTTPQIARFLERCVAAKKNILISGGTGSGKTTLLNILSSAIPDGERIVTIEDAAELQLHQPHVVRLETKPPNMEGKGAFAIRDLVKNALRMRPDRIVVGECRGGEALDMLQAMNTGHDGSLTTIHANSPEEALARLETLVLMAGLDLPARAIREQTSRSIHVIVQIARLGDGSRKITHVTEVTGLDRENRFMVRTLFEFTREGVEEDGTVLGSHEATGYLPSFVDEFLVRGLVRPEEPCI